MISVLRPILIFEDGLTMNAYELHKLLAEHYEVVPSYDLCQQAPCFYLKPKAEEKNNATVE